MDIGVDRVRQCMEEGQSVVCLSESTFVSSVLPAPDVLEEPIQWAAD
jgi:hypothetical protein